MALSHGISRVSGGGAAANAMHFRLDVFTHVQAGDRPRVPAADAAEAVRIADEIAPEHLELVGDEVEARRRFIEENAFNVANLDM